MKILQLGDLHYEEAHWRRPGELGIDQGWHDVADRVDELVEHAIAIEQTGEPIAVAFGGDLARTRNPSPSTYHHFAQAITALREHGIPVVAIPGNHDVDKAKGANALDPLTEVPGFHLFNRPGVAYVYGSIHGTEVYRSPSIGLDRKPTAAIVCVPWTPRSAVAAQLPADTPHEEICSRMGAAVAAIAKAEALDPISRGIPTFLLYHGTVSGAQTATGQLAHLFNEPVVSAIDLDQVGFAGVMLNHIHKRQAIGSIRPGATPIAYSSSVERLTFGDEDDAKGAILWTVPEEAATIDGPARADLEWIDTTARDFRTIDVLEFTDETGEPLWPEVLDAIVRVRLRREELDVDVEPVDLERSLLAAGAHRVAEVSIEEPDVAAQHEASDTARTDPRLALARWLETELPDNPAEENAVLMSMGLELLGHDAPPSIVVDGADLTPYVRDVDLQVEPGTSWDAAAGEIDQVEISTAPTT